MEFNAYFDSLGVNLKHHFSGGVYAKETHIPKGVKLSQHKHQFDHMSILGSGSVIVRGSGWVESFSAPAVIDIKAGDTHEVEALTDAVWFCVHKSDVTDPEKIDDALVADARRSIGVISEPS